MRWLLLILVALGLIAGGIFLAKQGNPPPQALVVPTTLPATLPATAPASQPKPKPAEFMDVVRLRYPDFPTTQPLMVPLSLPEAAKIILADPMYVDSLGELWITRSDADSTSNVLKANTEHSTHVIREHVVFVHRWPDDKGVWQPQLVCRQPDGHYEIVTQTTRQDITSNYNYDWRRAFEWNDAIVVPTDRGVSVIRPDRRPMELHQDLIAADKFDPNKFSQVQAMLDWHGLIAWMPWENEKIGSNGAVRFVDNKWTILDSAAGWPRKLAHLVPLLDGSIIQIEVNDDQSTSVNMDLLDPPQVDEKKINALVLQLSDADSDKRLAAFNELTRFGIGVWPILEKVQNDQPPEAQIRIAQLLQSKTQPTLGGMTLQPGPIKIIGRGEGGAVMIYSDTGVDIPHENSDQPQRITPAWIDIQPGRSIMLAPNRLTDELKIKGRTLFYLRGEQFVLDDVTGPMWWLSNHLSPPILKDKQLEFRNLIAIDGRGRWFFRKNETDDSPTLVIDPTLPDPTPRLPVWVYAVKDGKVGWSQDNWPAIKRGGAWALTENDWKPIDEKDGKEKFLAADDPAAALALRRGVAPAQPQDSSTTQPTTTPSLEPPLLIDPDGTQFFDGHEKLRLLTKTGKQSTWNLPPEAVGSGDVVLIRAGENRLFLFNSPGRVLRIKQTPDGPEPFKLDGVFTKNIPNVDHPDRIWLDPAGRIIIAYNGNSLAICFPTGRIPPEIAQKMTAKDLKEAEE